MFDHLQWSNTYIISYHWSLIHYADPMMISTASPARPQVGGVAIVALAGFKRSCKKTSKKMGFKQPVLGLPNKNGAINRQNSWECHLFKNEEGIVVVETLNVNQWKKDNDQRRIAAMRNDTSCSAPSGFKLIFTHPTIDIWYMGVS